MRIVLIKTQLAYEGFFLITRGFEDETAARNWAIEEKKLVMGSWEDHWVGIPDGGEALRHDENGTIWELISEDGNSSAVICAVRER